MSLNELDVLQKKNRMTREFDDAVEECHLKKMPLRQALDSLIPVLCRSLETRYVLVRSIDENLETLSLKTKGFQREWSRHIPGDFPEKSFPPRVIPLDNAKMIMASLDVVDRVIGLCGFVFTSSLEGKELEVKTDLVDFAAELLDNYLEGVASNARKQSITVFSTEALRDRIFEAGADKAVAHLCEELELEEFVLLYGDSDSALGEDLRYRYYKQGRMIHNSIDSPRPEFKAVLDHKQRALDEQDRSFSRLLGAGAMEKPLQNGLNQNLIGKLIIKPSGGGLNPESRDIIRIFGECLCQRLFDYNREPPVSGKMLLCC